MSVSVHEYRVDLHDLFAGPLDLLLYLVRRNELDILEIPLSKVVAQFVEYLDVLEFIDLDRIGDFLVLAGTLIEIKSRLALPRVEEEETEAEIEGEPRSELVQKLLEYKKFKDAAHALKARAVAWQERYPRLADDRPTSGRDASADRIKEVELWDLVSALSRIIRTKTVEKEGHIRYEETPISVYIERVSERVRKEGRVAFSSFFKNEKRRSRIVGVFLSILELLRHHAFRAEQPIDFEEIWILPPLADASSSATE
jgi:segregation and condensation protein A